MGHIVMVEMRSTRKILIVKLQRRKRKLEKLRQRRVENITRRYGKS
jgi:hypothetical protein